MPKTDVEYPTGGFVDNALRSGHKVLFHTVLFGKDYLWMQDYDGTIYLIRPDE